MVTRVAVTTGHFVSSDARAKKAALLFDRFAVFGLSSLRNDRGEWEALGWTFPGGVPEHGWEARFDWMLEHGLLYDERMTFHRPFRPSVKLEYSCLADPVLKEWTCDASIPENEVDSGGQRRPLPWVWSGACSETRAGILPQRFAGIRTAMP